MLPTTGGPADRGSHGVGEPRDGRTRLGSGVAAIWGRHRTCGKLNTTSTGKRNYASRLDSGRRQLDYQARDGSLNDDPTKVGGFYSMLQYGVFFPLGGLDYLPSQSSAATGSLDTSAAQTVRLFLGVVY